MKNITIAVLLLALSVVGYFAYAQSTAVVLATTSGDHTTCTTGAMWCLANDGLWRKLATDTAQVRVDVAQAAGVTSFNGLTGTVTSATAGIKYSELTAPPTSVTCSTATHSNTGLTTSGCQIK